MCQLQTKPMTTALGFGIKIDTKHFNFSSNASVKLPFFLSHNRDFKINKTGPIFTVFDKTGSAQF
jgi:hypothetical protein